MLRGDDNPPRKRRNGCDIDLDTVVESYVDSRTGKELSDCVFAKKRELERDMAVAFAVDMSGSTKGWIKESERESLILICEALELLSDRYSVFGFSGMTRKRCELYGIKGFEQRYGRTVQRRIAGITPQAYTSMGVVTRHLTQLLGGAEARTKLLITLLEGKSDDYDGYRRDTVSSAC